MRLRPSADRCAAVGELLIQEYARCGATERAKAVFESIADRCVAAWDTMVAAYAQNGQMEEALALFKSMDLQPDAQSFKTIFRVCGNLRSLREAKAVHRRFLSLGFTAGDLSTGNALISMYLRCGSLQGAKEAFDGMSMRNSVTWNSLISAYAKEGHLDEALHLHSRNDQEGFPTDAVSFSAMFTNCSCLRKARRLHLSAALRNLLHDNVLLETAVLNMYARCGSVQTARKVFESMYQRDLAAWNAMLSVYAQTGHGREALELFRRLLMEGFSPNAISFVGAATACSILSDLTSGKAVHAMVVVAGSEDQYNPILGAAILNMYAKCGCMDKAGEVFETMNRQEASSWNAMIIGYALCGCNEQAFWMLTRMDMEGIKPDRITFLNLVTACAGSGLMAQSRAIHRRALATQATIDPVLCNAFVNMYARCGGLVSAREVFESMKNRNQGSWNTIISAYAQHGHASESLELLRRMELEGECLSQVTLTVVLLACSHAGLEREAWFHLSETSVHHGISIAAEHYHCMVDLLGRVGKLEEAQGLMLTARPTLAEAESASGWKGLLAACKTHGDARLGALAFEHVAAGTTTASDSYPYVLFSSLTKAADSLTSDIGLSHLELGDLSSSAG